MPPGPGSAEPAGPPLTAKLTPQPGRASTSLPLPRLAAARRRLAPGRSGRSCDHGLVTAWQDVEQAVPEFAQRVRALFDAHTHKTIATLRADGSPRISGIEASFEDGELV